MNVPAKFEVRRFTHSWDNRDTQKIWAVPGCAHAPFSPATCLCLDDTMNVAAKFEECSVDLPVPEI